MKTHHIACYASVAAALLLSACGGGGDWEAEEVGACRSALVSLGGVTLASLDNPGVNKALYQEAAGTLVDFYNGIDPGTVGYKSFGSCRFSDGRVVSMTLEDGAVVDL